MDEDRKYYAGHPDGGLVDVEGVEWFKTDGYSGWYRREDGQLITRESPEFPNDSHARVFAISEAVAEEIHTALCPGEGHVPGACEPYTTVQNILFAHEVQ